MSDISPVQLSKYHPLSLTEYSLLDFIISHTLKVNFLDFRRTMPFLALCT